MPSSGNKKDEKKQTSSAQYPSTPKQPVTDELHREEARDDYRWLEDETEPEVKKWVEAQNEYTQTWLSGLPVENVYQELKQDIDAFTKSAPIMRDNYYFWYERQPGQDQAVLYRSGTLQDDKELVFDPNTLSDDASITLSFFRMSKTGQYGVYGIQESGEERDTVYTRNLETGEEEKFYFGRVFGMSWCDDERGFYYTVSDFENRGGDIADETHYQQVYYHRLGEPRDQDALLFNAVDYLPKDAVLGIQSSEDDRYVAVGASIGWREKHCFIIDVTANMVHKLGIPTETKTALYLLNGYIYATTDHEANYKRILRISLEKLDKPIDAWEEFVPEHPDHLIAKWGVTKNRIVIEYFHNVMSELMYFDRLTGKYIARIELPHSTDLSGLSTNKDYDEHFYSCTTFFSPKTHYRFDPDSETTELYWEDERAIDEKHFDVRQEWYESSDGTHIPMFIVGPKDQNGSDNPVLLTGYGGYGISRGPAFLGSYRPWLERGGYYVLANIRGGGEFGDEWHKGGIRENKQQSFDDFIAAADHCVSTGLTTSDRLVIQGGSNGGLLMGAVMTQRPELFGAVVAQVPVLDMYRYHKFLLAYRWTHEWGHPDVKEEFDWLKRYSPYHRADDTQKYPPILLTAGINDTRVHPMHAWKMAAKLQDGHPENVALLRTEMKAGHGPGKGFYQAVHDHAEALCFMMHCAGMLQPKEASSND